MVVIGNPPYSGESANKGKWIHDLLRGHDSITGMRTANYFDCDGQSLGERNPKGLNDDYVKFIRFAQWRIEQTGHGILAFVTNHAYLDNPTFKGMREKLLKSFDEIYIVDLHGNTRKKEISADGKPDQNVFDIQQGVAIGLFVRKGGHTQHKADEVQPNAKVFRFDLFGNREEKYAWLKKSSFASTKWNEVNPTSTFYRFEYQDEDLWDEYKKGWKLTDIFPVKSVGIFTGRDALAVHFNEEEAFNTVRRFIGMSENDARETWNLGNDTQDWKVRTAQKDIVDTAFSRNRVIPILYRPFDTRFTYYTGKSSGFLSRPRPAITNQMIQRKTIALISSRMTKGESFHHVHFTRNMAEKICLSPKTSNNGFIFPLYLYDLEGELKLSQNNVRFNLARDFIEHVESKLDIRFSNKAAGIGNDTFGAEDLFHYVAAIISTPTYQSRFEDCLRVDYPRIPVTSDVNLFWGLVEVGRDIVRGHLMETAEEAATFPERGSNVVEKIKFDGTNKLSINDRQYFQGVSKRVVEFQ